MSDVFVGLSVPGSAEGRSEIDVLIPSVHLSGSNWGSRE